MTVATALLVYFGWVRSEVQSRLLGIDESLLGMSTQDYLLRSVRSVLILLAVVAVVGLLWIAVDRALSARLATSGPEDLLYRSAVGLLPAGIVVLPLSAWLLRESWPVVAFVSYPLCVGIGLLLLVYALHLRQSLSGARPFAPLHVRLLKGFVGLVLALALFSTAANYATVEGTELAASFEASLPELVGVVVHSEEDLHLDAPGLCLDVLGEDEQRTFRYSCLRLLEHTGERYFLVSEGWTPQYGVVLMLSDEDPVRLEFVRDRRSR